MNIYERYDVEPIINVAGTKTIYGGSLMSKKVADAMREASKYSVHIYQLQAAASKIIAQKTHAEAGLVTSGAFAALTLSAAACICKFDVSKMNRLPNTNGLPNEFIMPWHQINGYARSIEAAGGRIISAGLPNHVPSAFEVIPTTIDDLRANINEKTVGIMYVPRDNSHPPLPEVIALAREYQIPVILDAANQVPPVKNLYHFIDIGADLVCFSGGKGIRGPQGSGILCGRRDLVSSAALQMLDMAVEPFPDWEPPKGFILKEEMKGRPQHGVGRGGKVDKETIIGLLTALEDLTEDSFRRKSSELEGCLELISQSINNIKGVTSKITVANVGTYPMLQVRIDDDKCSKNIKQIVKELKENGIYPFEYQLHEGIFHIHSLNVDEETAIIVRDSLLEILR